MNIGLLRKFKHSFISLSPIFVLVLILGLTITPLKSYHLLSFIISSALFIVGMSLFTLGADNSMLPMGNHIGASLTKIKKLWIAILICFLVGTIITTAEPDLTVLAKQVSSVPSSVLIIAVSVGVGIFLSFALLRIIFKIKLNIILLISYLLAFLIALFSKSQLFAVGFDSGGVTTGPITSPLILALGVGICSVLEGKHSQEDSFGLLSLCAVGPILTVLLLSFFYKGEATQVSSDFLINGYGDIFPVLIKNLKVCFQEVTPAFILIGLLFFVFQIFALKLPKDEFIRIMINLLFTYLGVVLFLTSVNTGFMLAGEKIGQQLGKYKFLTIIIGFLLGFFIVLTEPAVEVFNEQIEIVSGNTISKKHLQITMAIGVGLAISLSLLRIILGINIAYFLVLGYVFALVLSFLCPKIYMSAAFDAGGVATGPLTASFILPFVIGFTTNFTNSNDAFGIVAMEALIPIITIEIFGILSHKKQVFNSKYMENYIVDDKIYDF